MKLANKHKLFIQLNHEAFRKPNSQYQNYHGEAHTTANYPLVVPRYEHPQCGH